MKISYEVLKKQKFKNNILEDFNARSIQCTGCLGKVTACAKNSQVKKSVTASYSTPFLGEISIVLCSPYEYLFKKCRAKNSKCSTTQNKSRKRFLLTSAKN